MKDYPLELYLIDETKLLVRPIKHNEIGSLNNFYSKIPKYDLVIYRDSDAKVDSEENMISGSENPNFVQLGAFNNNEIVAKGTLHSEGKYLSNAAEIKLIVDPVYRHKGLGSQIFNLLLFEGLKLGHKKIIVRYSLKNHHITKILNNYGFKPETELNFFLDDKEVDQKADLIIASFDLENWQRRFEFYHAIDNS